MVGGGSANIVRILDRNSGRSLVTWFHGGPGLGESVCWGILGLFRLGKLCVGVVG